MQDDDFDELFDDFMKKKKVGKIKKVGHTALNKLPLWKETGISDPNYKCLICRRVMDDDDIVEACDSCERYFHYRHIREWLKIKAVCPNCKQ